MSTMEQHFESMHDFLVTAKNVKGEEYARGLMLSFSLLQIQDIVQGSVPKAVYAAMKEQFSDIAIAICEAHHIRIDDKDPADISDFSRDINRMIDMKQAAGKQLKKNG